MKYQKLLWEFVQELRSEENKIKYLQAKNELSDNLSNKKLSEIHLILGGTDLVKDLTYEDFHQLLKDVIYLNNCKSIQHFKRENCNNTKNLNLLIHSLKIYKEMNDDIVKTYRGKQFVDTRKFAQSLIKGCEYYIQQLKEELK